MSLLLLKFVLHDKSFVGGKHVQDVGIRVVVLFHIP